MDVRAVLDTRGAAQMPIRNDFGVICSLREIDDIRRYLAEMSGAVELLHRSLDTIKDVIDSVMYDYHEDGTACPASAEAEYANEFDGDELEDNGEWPLE